MKAKAKKLGVTFGSLVLIATVTYTASTLGVGVFWSTLASGLAGTLGGYMKNNA
jgi:hypothetical protein